ncbi:MAG: prephenate dehydratase [Dehalococcoidia bacterium]|nr:prephenate dehydratase [Dehalococcoidia bacterium]
MIRRVGFLQPPGTFGEEAALLYAPDAELVPLPSNGAIVVAVETGDVDEGVVPVENSLDGPINETLDGLIRHEHVYLRTELVLPVEQNLIAARGTTMEQITVVMSHPSALAQCRAFLESKLPLARLEATLSTAGAAAVAARQFGTAAIGTRRAAELAGAEILAETIQDTAHNVTRFLALGREDARPSGLDKTSIAFMVAHDQPGTLLGVLQELADRSLNLTRIESRPSRESLGVYVFQIDFEGHREDPSVAAALSGIEAHAQYFRLLGSYPQAVRQTATDGNGT